MFGSKLRSWMENHIVRPRKKANKNKNSNGSVEPTIPITTSCAQDAYKNDNASGYTIYHGSGTMPTTQTTTATNAATSAGTTSISQSGNLKVSGGNNSGCSSTSTKSNSSVHQYNGGCSNTIISSPARRRDVSPIQNHSRYGWQTPDQDVSITSPKSDNFLYTPKQHSLKNVYATQITKECSSEGKMPEHRHTLKQPSQPNYSSSSISSLSWSTGSKEPSLSCNSNNNYNINSNQQVKLNIPKMEFNVSCDTSLPTVGNTDEDPDAVHYEEIQTILRHPENHANNRNQNCVQLERPKSEQLSSYAPNRAYFYDECLQDDASPRYGRLLPSKIQPQTSGSFDTLNTHEFRNTGYLVNNNLNYPYYLQDQEASRHASPGAAANVTIQKTMSVSTSRQRLRNSRYTAHTKVAGSNNGGVAEAPQVPNMGILHSLSSPESAYSTGYSTDGTSPGGIYTPPEYYINMRTGTHYFPKSINSLAIEAQRYKFGLNKIEEMSPIDPLPTTSFANATGNAKVSKEICQKFQQSLNKDMENGPALRNSIVLPTLQGFESPSPRQRCRIRTNPWYSTTDTSSSGTTVAMANLQHFQVPSNTNSSTVSSSKSAESSMSVMKMELDAASTSSSGIKSSNEAEDISPDKSNSTNNNKINGNASYESSESSSSLTEVENKQRTYSPNTIRHKRSTSGVIQQKHASQHNNNNKESPVANFFKSSERNDSPFDGTSAGTLSYADYIFMSDDDATLNEMMGKFDESYVYEKETDILSSDSDLTNCVSDLDTGQDAGDECETDELLDIDFIDTSSVQEANDTKQSAWSNIANFNYFNNNKSRTSVKLHKKLQRSPCKLVKTDVENNRVRTVSSSSAQRRKKRFFKTRKKNTDQSNKINVCEQICRETRSVGGTPVSLRKNTQIKKDNVNKESNNKISPLVNRSSSLVLADATNELSFMTLAESEKTLLKADLEADIKYRLLITEAETLLASMRNSVLSIPRETPVPSPRRINPLINKRVEILKNSEVEPKKEKHVRQRSLDASSHAEQELGAVINKRVEHLKQESSSVPSSPRSRVRSSPRKTHVTNFISQNVFNEPFRKLHTEDSSSLLLSPKPYLNGHRIGSLNYSPLLHRRNRSQSPKLSRINNEESDSDMDIKFHRAFSAIKSSLEDMENHNYLPPAGISNGYHAENFSKPKFIHFNSADSFHCPQSEPLKRKVYKNSSTYERIKQSFELDSEIPKQMLLQKIHSIRRDRYQCGSQDLNHLNTVGNASNKEKQQLMVAIADLKRSLENQSVELNGLNEV